MGSLMTFFYRAVLYKERSSHVTFWIRKVGDCRPWTVVQIDANDGKTINPRRMTLLEKDKQTINNTPN